MKVSLLVAAALAVLPGVALSAEKAPPMGKAAACAITSLPSNEVQYKGACRFLPEQGGSFTLLSPGGQGALYGSIGAVSVTITGKNEASVSGLVLDEGGGGHSSRWGDARRSKQDRACWDGEDFRVCAR